MDSYLFGEYIRKVIFLMEKVFFNTCIHMCVGLAWKGGIYGVKNNLDSKCKDKNMGTIKIQIHLRN